MYVQNSSVLLFVAASVALYVCVISNKFFKRKIMFFSLGLA
jgi:hypothetical protein